MRVRKRAIYVKDVCRIYRRFFQGCHAQLISSAIKSRHGKKRYDKNLSGKKKNTIFVKRRLRKKIHFFLNFEGQARLLRSFVSNRERYSDMFENANLTFKTGIKPKVVQLRRIFLTLSLLFLFPLFPFYSVKSVLRPNYVSNGWLLSNLKVVTFLQIFVCFSLNVNFRFFLLFKRLRYTTHYRMSAVIFIVRR